MRTDRPNRRPLLGTVFLLVALVVALLARLESACTMGGNEGDRCNALVLRDECNSGLHCKAADCSASYCCPINGPSGDPNCNTAGCPATDGGDEGGADGGIDAQAESGTPADAGITDASDAG
jgi:hypothetical protein